VKPRSPVVDAHTLVLAALDCVMAPILYDAPDWASTDAEVATFGPAAASCATAARAAHIGSARLYRVDSDAIVDVRRAIRLSPTTASFDPVDTVSLFDQGLAAVMEARRARSALAREAPHPSPEAVEKIRARAMIVSLDDYGQRKGGSIGIEARAVAKLMAANEFLKVAQVKPVVRPYVAEPLFTMMFGSEFVSESPDEPPASWDEYLAAAARAAPQPPNDGAAAKTEDGRVDASSGAVGGGPIEDGNKDLHAVTNSVAAEMRALAAALPNGHLRVALERTVRDLLAFEVKPAKEANLD
jgi:hypothetical protein